MASSKLAKLVSWEKKKEGRVESFDNQKLFFWHSKSWCMLLATSDHNFYWSNNALQCHAAFYCFTEYFWYMECYIFYCLSCKDCSKGLWCEWLQEGLAAHVSARCAEGVVPTGFCLGSALHCAGQTGSSEIPPFLYHCPVLLGLMSLCHFSLRVLTVFLYCQYWVWVFWMSVLLNT